MYAAEKYNEAIAAYQAGLGIDSSHARCQQGLQRAQVEDISMNILVIIFLLNIDLLFPSHNKLLYTDESK